MTIRATSTVVIGYCINHWDYFARQATRPMQEALEPVSYPTHSYNFVLREPVGVCAGHHPVELPARDGGLEDRAGARDGQHVRPEAGVEHAADGAASSPSSSTRPTCRRASST